MKINRILFCLLLSFVFLTSQAEQLSAKDSYRTLNMVFVPASEKSEANSFRSLMDIVTKLTGIKFKFIKITDYNGAVEAMRAGRADLAWFGAATYVIAADIASAEAFAAGIPKGQKDAGYYTYFVVRKNSPIKTLADAKGKILALNHIGSTSGDYIPRVELLKVNLDTQNRRHFKRVYYAGSHDACLLSVVNNHAQICGMSSHNYKGRIADGTVSPESVRIVHISPKVPPAPLAYSKKLPLEIRKSIKEAVLMAHKHGKIGGWGGDMEKYISLEDKDFNLIRDVRKIVEKK
ncbi:MAG: phosphate/phosphite/phosphonate ABC transporter substrate-binding protein [Proteobacteria bacterium]|nr:phosphate/phosphite/phosphonate ABC transporter substrate-binding protein [Pseudomonadota bacterium]